MIIMPIKEGENIERALKKFKRKYEKTGVLKELRRRQYFTKRPLGRSGAPSAQHRRAAAARRRVASLLTARFQSPALRVTTPALREVLFKIKGYL